MSRGGRRFRYYRCNDCDNEIRLAGRVRAVWCGACGSHSVRQVTAPKQTRDRLHPDSAVLYDERSQEYLNRGDDE